MNRPDFCAKLLGQIGGDDVLRPYLDEVLVMEQGTQKVVDSPEFAKAQAVLGSTLRVIEQGNMGGSGGYARGQLESVTKGTATYLMCMDDDVVCEPEGIIRAVTFGDLARRPTIVGGHMFSLYSRSRLHSFGEIVQPWRFWWQSAPSVITDWDFAARNLRSARWLHKRIDVDFNGWFMCLIPRQVLDEIGLSLPLFIKWDDAEFGLRAKAAGYPTVTFPGAAVWHIPWTDKNDALDWQAYFHQRNRFVAALLHSPYPRGGRMIRESLNHQIKHLVSMQYSTVELRHQAIEDVLAGPDSLHAELPVKLGKIREFVKQFTDAQLEVDRDAFPPVRRKKPPRRGRDDMEIPGRLSQLVTAGLAPDPPAPERARPLPGVPRGRGPGHGRQVVPPRALRLGRGLDERRHVCRALPPGPGEVPRAAAPHDRDPRADLPRVAERSPGSTATSSRRSPRPSGGRRPSRTRRRSPDEGCQQGRAGRGQGRGQGPDEGADKGEAPGARTLPSAPGG